jgi:hypothetical protein
MGLLLDCLVRGAYGALYWAVSLIDLNGHSNHLQAK